MQRAKKYTYENVDTPAPKKTVFVERDARMITNEKMYAEDNKSSMIVGVAMAGEIVRVLEQSTEPDKHMSKIRTLTTNRTGYVNPRSIL